MALAKTLPIYRTAMKLVQHLHQCTRKAPRDLRFTLIQRLLNECVEICVDAADANRSRGRTRIERLERLANRVARVEVLTIVATEQQCMSVGAAGIAIDQVEDLARQVTGWTKATKTSVTTASQNPPAHATGGERIN